MSLLAAGASILGGLLGRQKSMSPGKQIQSHVTGAMLAADTYGLNPLTVLGIPPMAHQQGNNALLGQAIIDSGMMLMDKLSSKGREADAVNRLARANRRLQSTVEQLTLRPPVPGVYARRNALPSRAQALGVQPANQSDESENADGRLLQDFSSNGVTSTLAVGPDVDELATGWFIDNLNKGKANAYTRTQYGMGNGSPRRASFGINPTYAEPKPRKKTNEYWNAFKAGGANAVFQWLAEPKPAYRPRGASGAW